MEPKEFTRRLRRLINRNDVITLLDQGDFTPGGDWGAGGCWILAEALKKFLAFPASLWAVSSAEVPVEHVMVKYRSLFIDYLGARTGEVFRRDYEGTLMPPSLVRLVPFTRELKKEARARGIPYDPKIVRKLVALMRAEF